MGKVPAEELKIELVLILCVERMKSTSDHSSASRSDQALSCKTPTKLLACCTCVGWPGLHAFPN